MHGSNLTVWADRVVTKNTKHLACMCSVCLWAKRYDIIRDMINTPLTVRVQVHETV